MGRKPNVIAAIQNNDDSIYDEILQEYLEIRKETLNKLEKANTKIKDAKAAIEENTKLMEKATKDGDLDAYAELKADNAKNEEIIKFFQSVIENAKHNSVDSADKIEALNRKAAAEKARIKKEFKKDFIKALAPAIEVAREAYKDISLIGLAENKITNNLQNTPAYYRDLGVGDIAFFCALEQILQSPEYRETPGAPTNMKKGNAGMSNDWLESSRAAVENEKARWI